MYTKELIEIITNHGGSASFDQIVDAYEITHKVWVQSEQKAILKNILVGNPDLFTFDESEMIWRINAKEETDISATTEGGLSVLDHLKRIASDTTITLTSDDNRSIVDFGERVRLLTYQSAKEEIEKAIPGYTVTPSRKKDGPIRFDNFFIGPFFKKGLRCAVDNLDTGKCHFTLNLNQYGSAFDTNNLKYRTHKSKPLLYYDFLFQDLVKEFNKVLSITDYSFDK